MNLMVKSEMKYLGFSGTKSNILKWDPLHLMKLHFPITDIYLGLP